MVDFQNLVWFHLPSLHELHRVARELCKSHFSKLKLSFFPFVALGFASGLASSHGSRGRTALHAAASYGHNSVVERLLEAKVAVDAQDNEGRGLGRGSGGELKFFGAYCLSLG